MRQPSPVNSTSVGGAAITFVILTVLGAGAVIGVSGYAGPSSLILSGAIAFWAGGVALVLLDGQSLKQARIDAGAAWNESHFDSWATQAIRLCRERDEIDPETLAVRWKKDVRGRWHKTIIVAVLGWCALAGLAVFRPESAVLLGLAAAVAVLLTVVGLIPLTRFRDWDAVIAEWEREAITSLARKSAKPPKPRRRLERASEPDPEPELQLQIRPVAKPVTVPPPEIVPQPPKVVIPPLRRPELEPEPEPQFELLAPPVVIPPVPVPLLEPILAPEPPPIIVHEPPVFVHEPPFILEEPLAETKTPVTADNGDTGEKETIVKAELLPTVKPPVKEEIPVVIESADTDEAPF
ncbi:hypothetical protein [Zavarzinella formosa]|uniref:hypothetical protein n=1 Tax=Zavarzinella formosa TaxID=360055 RepID=UPI0002F644EB|nr:hypothetical protein [Zavarzinella formosa]